MNIAGASGLERLQVAGFKGRFVADNDLRQRGLHIWPIAHHGDVRQACALPARSYLLRWLPIRLPPPLPANDSALAAALEKANGSLVEVDPKDFQTRLQTTGGAIVPLPCRSGLGGHFGVHFGPRIGRLSIQLWGALWLISGRDFEPDFGHQNDDRKSELPY